MVPEMEVYTPLGIGSDVWGPIAIPLHPRSMEKIAGETYTPQKLLEFMDRIRPRDEGRYVLLNAIGAYEYWSSNSNADAFPEWSLKGEPPTPMVKDFIRAKGLPIPTDYGCDTFERYAYTYRWHQNQDPSLTIGERVCCAAYNDKMHRVELIVYVSKEKAPDLIEKIDSGVPIPWSMGAKLPYDICSVCMNVATRREDYCDHLKNMKNHVLPDGSKVFSWNWFPRFFDISAVVVPADRSAYSLRKVASAGGPFEALPPEQGLVRAPVGMEKFAGLFDFLSGTKKAAIEKEVPVEEPSKNLGPSPMDPDAWKVLYNRVVKDQATSETMPAEMAGLRGFSPQAILSALTSLGIILKPEEAGYLLGDQKIPSDLDLQPPDPTLLSRAKGLIEKRSMFDPFFSLRESKESSGSLWRPMVLVKRAEAYDSYRTWLMHLDLDDLKVVTSHPSVRMLLNPGLLEEKVLGLEKAASGVPSFIEMVTPFVAGASAGW